MKDPRKIRITLNLDVTLDQSEYGPDGQSAEEMLEYVRGRGPRIVSEWTLDYGPTFDFSAEIVE